MKKWRGTKAGRQIPFYLLTFLLVCSLSSCFVFKKGAKTGGEVTGESGRAFREPTPYGMTLIKRGHLKMGLDKQDSCGASRCLSGTSPWKASGWTSAR